MAVDFTLHCMDMSNHKAMNMLLSLSLMLALIWQPDLLSKGQMRSTSKNYDAHSWLIVGLGAS